MKFAVEVLSFEEVSSLSIAVVFVQLEDPSSNTSLVPSKLNIASSISERERDGGNFMVEPDGIYVNEDDFVGSRCTVNVEYG